MTVPDYENPTDAGANNVYDVIAQVSDGKGGTDTQILAVTVQNVSGVALTGTAGNDTLIGTIEEDPLSGLAGNDILTRGVGNDLFVFHHGEASGDVMSDFAHGVDSLEFHGSAAGAAFTRIGITNQWQIQDGVPAAATIISAIIQGSPHLIIISRDLVASVRPGRGIIPIHVAVAASTPDDNSENWRGHARRFRWEDHNDQAISQCTKGQSRRGAYFVDPETGRAFWVASDARVTRTYFRFAWRSRTTTMSQEGCANSLNRAIGRSQARPARDAMTAPIAAISLIGMIETGAITAGPARCPGRSVAYSGSVPGSPDRPRHVHTTKRRCRAGPPRRGSRSGVFSQLRLAAP